MAGYWPSSFFCNAASKSKSPVVYTKVSSPGEGKHNSVRPNSSIQLPLSFLLTLPYLQLCFHDFHDLYKVFCLLK